MNSSGQSLLFRFLKFGIVGGSGVLVNLGLYYLLTRKMGLFDTLHGRYVSYVISIEISIITNFFLNDVWTFADRREGVAWSNRFLRFHVVSLVGVGVNAGIFAVLNWLMMTRGLTIVGTITAFGRTENIDDLLAACIGIIAAMMWNFFANLFWTWKEK